LSGAQDDPRYFQISVPVQPGNSGGALVDEHGNVIGIVSAKLDASAALAASGALPENVNYAVKSSLLLSFLESVPDVSAKLKDPITSDRKFEDIVQSAQDATGAGFGVLSNPPSCCSAIAAALQQLRNAPKSRPRHPGNGRDAALRCP
jgi:S1-C subfamily serine protease